MKQGILAVITALVFCSCEAAELYKVQAALAVVQEGLGEVATTVDGVTQAVDGIEDSVGHDGGGESLGQKVGELADQLANIWKDIDSVASASEQAVAMAETADANAAAARLTAERSSTLSQAATDRVATVEAAGEEQGIPGVSPTAELLIAAAGAAFGTNIYRNSRRRARGEPVSPQEAKRA